MAEEQLGEDLRLHFALRRFLQASRVARLVGAVRINLRGEEQRVAMRGPSNAVGFGGKGSQGPGVAAIERKNPNLRTAPARGNERQRFAVGGPARARVGAVAARQLPRLATLGGNHPDVPHRLVGGEIDHAGFVGDPLAVRR